MIPRSILGALSCLAACTAVPGPAPPSAPSAPPAESAAPPANGPAETGPAPAPSEATQDPAGAPEPASALAGEGYLALGERRGINVYRREKLPGIELAAAGIIKGTPDQVRRVLLDYPNHERWQKHLKEQKILAKGDAFLDVYERLELPMLDDRDFILHVTWGTEGEVLWMRFATTSAIGPAPVEGVVRVTAHHGSWRLQPAPGGKSTLAVYRFQIDLAGMFPSWLGSGQATNDLPELFENITRELAHYP